MVCDTTSEQPVAKPAHVMPPPALDDSDTGFRSVVLPCSDGAPVRVTARLLHSATNDELDRPAYSELRIFVCTAGFHVAAVSVRRSALMLDDRHLALVCATFDDALDAIETFDPIGDWREPDLLASRHGAGRLIAVVALRLKLERLREDHRQLVERSLTLWGSTPSMITKPTVAAPPAPTPEVASARLAIKPPKG